MKASLNETVFDIYSPTTDHCVGLISIPHSGLYIPQEFNEFLTNDSKLLDKDVDFGVHELVNIERLRDLGLTVIKSNIHRTAIDLNRAPADCVLNWKSNSHGEKIVLQTPDVSKENFLRGKYYSPYFETLTSSLDYIQTIFEKKFGKNKRASFVDLHSMPSHPTEYHLQKNPNQDTERPDFCLSDQFGKSCEEEYILKAKELFDKLGYNTKINSPYVGGYITQKYISHKVNNIQIEIKRNLYMDEISRSHVTEKKELLKNNLMKVLEEFFLSFYH